jgi:membrane dipeptidase
MIPSSSPTPQVYTYAKPMRTRALIAVLVFAALPAFLSAQTFAKLAAKMMPKQNPEGVHRSAIVIDTHADTAQRFIDEHYDLADPLNGGNLNLDSAQKGNLGAEFFSIWVEPVLYRGQYSHRTLELIDAVKQQAAAHSDRVSFVTSSAGIEQAHHDHKLAALIGIEGGQSIEDSLSLLRLYYVLGVRYMTLTWSNSNSWADSSGDINDTSIPHTKDGLTDFGKQVIAEMNRLGMMVDLSHASDQTFYRTLAVTKAPVIVSHSSARALCNSPRNLTDEMLVAVAHSGGPKSKGGVVQVNFYSGFLSQAYRNAQISQRAEINKAIEEMKTKNQADGRQVTYADVDKIEREFASRIPRPPFSILIDHIDHIAKVAGVDHVGLGADFDGINNQLPEGIDSAADLPKITEALMARGYSADDCRKILGGNLLRVFREVEQAAKELQAAGQPKAAAQQPADEGKK